MLKSRLFGAAGIVAVVVFPGIVVAARSVKTAVNPAAPIPAYIVNRRRSARLKSRRRRAESSSPGPAIADRLAREVLRKHEMHRKRTEPRNAMLGAPREGSTAE